jgi:hypothetical protein
MPPSVACMPFSANSMNAIAVITAMVTRNKERADVEKLVGLQVAI